MTEPDAGCDIENETMQGKKIKTTAKQVGDQWVINGQKMWASNCGIADFYNVVCTTDRTRGMGTALSSFRRTRRGSRSGSLKTRGHGVRPQLPMYLDDVRVPLDYRVAGPARILSC
jgi:alkylation response protein AidB-like acyl-CoA dehydrogenase